MRCHGFSVTVFVLDDGTCEAYATGMYEVNGKGQTGAVLRGVGMGPSEAAAEAIRACVLAPVPARGGK